MIAHAAQLLEPVEGGEGIGGVAVRAAKNDLPGDGVKGFRRRGDQRAGGEVALGKPWSLIEEPRRLVERLDVDLDDRGAKGVKPRERRRISGGRCRVPEEQALAELGRAEPRTGGGRGGPPPAAGGRGGAAGAAGARRGATAEDAA